MATLKLTVSNFRERKKWPLQNCSTELAFQKMLTLVRLRRHWNERKTDKNNFLYQQNNRLINKSMKNTVKRLCSKEFLLNLF